MLILSVWLSIKGLTERVPADGLVPDTQEGKHTSLSSLKTLSDVLQIPEQFASWKKLCKEVRRLQRALYFGLLEGWQ